MKNIFLYTLAIIFFSCDSPETNKRVIFPTDTVNINLQDSLNKIRITNPDTVVFETHLMDTTTIRGNFVLFLRPDSLRFESYVKEADAGIYEADSDFGVGVSTTIERISKSKKYKNIQTAISDKRYIRIIGCKNSPLLIDRDTINYAIILTAGGSDIKMISFIHSGDYINDIDEYFSLSKKR